jgi:hypothetical protein
VDWLTFVATIIGSLAWPVATLVLVLALRKQIVELLPHVRKLKAGPVEAEFEREVKAIEAEVEVSVPRLEPTVVETPSDRLYKLAQVSPRAAILEAWQGIEFTARRAILQHAGSPIPDVSSPLRVAKELARLKLLSPEDLALFHDLRGLRNQATHAPDFSPSFDAVSRYLQLSAGLERRLSQQAEVES